MKLIMLSILLITASAHANLDKIYEQLSKASDIKVVTQAISQTSDPEQLSELVKMAQEKLLRLHHSPTQLVLQLQQLSQSLAQKHAGLARELMHKSQLLQNFSGTDLFNFVRQLADKKYISHTQRFVLFAVTRKVPRDLLFYQYLAEVLYDQPQSMNKLVAWLQKNDERPEGRLFWSLIKREYLFAYGAGKQESLSAHQAQTLSQLEQNYAKLSI